MRCEINMFVIYARNQVIFYSIMYFLPANNADIPFFLYSWAIARSVETAGSEYRGKVTGTLKGMKYGFINKRNVDRVGRNNNYNNFIY